MKSLYIPFLILLTWLAGSVQTQAQSLRDIMNKLNLYQQKYPEEVVYLQSDRNRYAPGDKLWFKAYVLADLGEKRNLSSDLHAGIVDKDGQEVTQAWFNIENGQVNGDLEIPPQVSPGRYLLIAYTSWMQNTPVERIFVKEILIETEEVPAFSINLKLNDTLFADNSHVSADIECLDRKGKPVLAALQYKLFVDGTVALEGVNKTDKSGRAKLAFDLPKGNAGRKLELNVFATVKYTSVGVGLVIPTPENVVDVSFFPEGGTLISGKRTNMAYRAFNALDRPADFEGEIYDFEKGVGKIGNTWQGIGSFVFTPEREQAYSLNITKPAGIDKTFDLPEPRRSGVIMSVTDKTPDSLKIDFQQINKRIQTYHFIGQMKGRIYWMESRRVDLKAQVNIPLGDFPAGVAEIAAFDSAMNLVAKRLVYVNQNKKLYIEIIPDKTQYASKERTTLSIRVRDEKGNPVQSVLSLAAAPTHEQQPIADNCDLFSLATLKSDLMGFVPSPASYFGPDENVVQLLDVLLIANAYSRFTWKTVLNTNITDPSYRNMDDNTDDLASLYFNQEAVAYCGRILTNSMATPGTLFNLQRKNDIDSWIPVTSDQPGNNAFRGRMTVREIIYQIKPYDLIGGKIYFLNSGVNSITNQDGAIIAINGISMGTDISVVDGILPVDIDHIKISTNPMDIQQYTALNTMGVVEIYTKKAEAFNNSDMADAEMKKSRVYRTPSPFVPAGKTAGSKRGNAKPVSTGTTYWDPDIKTDPSGMAKVSFINGSNAGEISVTVEGTSATGLYGGTVITFVVE